jgi:hypothetical protein
MTINPSHQRKIYHHHRACIISSNSRRSLTTKSPSWQSSLLVTANYGDAYAPLEQAISLINRVISVTTPSKRAPQQDDKEQARQRWVQLRAVINQSKTISITTTTTTSTSTTKYSLSDYLSLPVNQYSLLDPKWISRIDNNVFLIRIPFSDLLGVDLTPEIQINVITPGGRRTGRLGSMIGSLNNTNSITSYTSTEAEEDGSSSNGTFSGARALGGNGGARVVFEGSNAKLGNPELDEAFKLNLTAVVGEHKKRWDPPPLPGRPVYRLKKWAAARNEAAREERNISNGSDVEEDGGGVMVVEEEDNGNSVIDSSNNSFIARLSSNNDIDDNGDKNEEKLFCRVKVNMSMRVPKALKLLPNPVLGAAGSAILKAVVSTTLPNFLNLLSDDYVRWLLSVEQHGDEEDDGDGKMVVVAQGGSNKRDVNAPVGELFSPSSSPSSSA